MAADSISRTCLASSSEDGRAWTAPPDGVVLPADVAEFREVVSNFMPEVYQAGIGGFSVFLRNSKGSMRYWMNEA